MISGGMEARLRQKNRRLFIVCKILLIGYALIYTFCFFASIFILIGYETDVEKNRINQVIVSIDAFLYQNYYVSFMYLLYFIEMLLRIIEEHVEQVLNSAEEMLERDVFITLKLVRILLDKISDTLENIQKCYVINTLLFLQYYTFSAIFCVFGVITYFLMGSQQAFVIYMLVMWLCYQSPFIIWTFLYASRIKRRGINILAMCYKLLFKYRSTSKICKNIQILTLQFHHRRPLFSCGLFVLDWYFLFFTIGFAFSFLVIFLQFETQM